jgi:alkylation response protein AidB-like acyl-CoA dehydrogenase
MSCCPQHPLVEQARLYANAHLRPRAGEFEAAGGIPVAVIREMGTLGFLGSVLPAEFGGSAIDVLSYGLLTEAIGMGCPSTRALLTVNTSLVGETLAKLGTREQKQRWLVPMAKGEKIACFALTEPNVGSDAAAIETTYREESDAFVINGRKRWITYGAIADYVLVLAALNGVCSAFLVERGTPGFESQPIKGLLASRAAHLGELTFREVRVPKNHLISQEGGGFSFVANQALFHGRYSIAWAGLALAGAAIEEMCTYARSRKQYGRMIGQHQLVQGLIADSVTSQHASRALCERIARLRHENDDDAVMETNIAKLHTSRAAMEITTRAIQVLGGVGCSDQYSVERLFREAKILEIIEGSTQIQQMMISNFALRRYYRRELKRTA